MADGANCGQTLTSLERDTLRLPRTPGEPLERDLVRVVVEQLAKTVGVRILSRIRTQDAVPSVDRALDRLLRDELVHRDFGWTLRAWLLAAPLAPMYRTQLRDELPAMLTTVRENHGGLLLEHHGAEMLATHDRELSERTRGWGTLSTLDHIAAVDEAFTLDFAPRFAALDVEMPEGS